MRHIHPFPARMAPEIALERISKMKPGQIVLDPMSGSGMVLAVAARQGIKSIGIDTDPLARLISRTCSTKVDRDEVLLALKKLIDLATGTVAGSGALPWIDNDKETTEFVGYWFGERQVAQLRALSFNLISMPFLQHDDVRNVLLVALSRLIVTKEPKASLARDTAHSRPHRTITNNDFDVLGAMTSSVQHVLNALHPESIMVDSDTALGDSREISSVENEAVDSVITSPPYFNAIDYLRGHKMSLIWFGYSIEELRRIRAAAIGTERSADTQITSHFTEVATRLRLNSLADRERRMLARYFGDLCAQLKETKRVLRPGGGACYVIGNSDVRGNFVSNSELLKEAALLSGLSVVSETTRQIPDNSRYLPVQTKTGGSLARRMRTEHVIEFSKAA